MKRTEILAKFDLVSRRRIALTTERSYRTWTMGYARKECLDLPSPINNLKKRA
jgi:hypothetical protein